jgi:2-hydroxy-3-keto-5-methylthiopentenyl-1-phosphate phosphatase
MDSTTNVIAEISDYAGALNESDQKKLLHALKRKVLMDEANKLNKSVLKNNISMQEICDIVSDVRIKNKTSLRPDSYRDSPVV